jgi:TRAP-type C4-dicarboxylate transport system substrate-binding protein
MNRYRWYLIFVFTFFADLFAQQYTIKFASLAPEGSTWLNVMREYDAAIRKESGGRLGFKIYAGGVAGDEKDVLRKIRLGQFHAGGFTGVGMGEMAPTVRILESPFLFKNYQEVDYIYEKFGDEFRQEFEKNGFVKLGWAEVGFVYVFSKEPIVSVNDFKRKKIWAWEGDVVAEATFKALEISPIPLSVTDVMTSLQTNLIDAAYSSPLACIALQWFTRVHYMTTLPLADAAGAVLISKKMFDTLPPDLQEILLRNGNKYLDQLTKMSRDDNQKSIETLKQQGIKLSDPVSKDELPLYEQAGKKARQLLVGKVYSQEFLERFEKVIAEYRQNQKK